MVHQHFRLVERFTVAENLVLGDKRGAGRRFRIDPRAVESQVRALGERYHLAGRPARARVAARRSASSSASRSSTPSTRTRDVLILDEPTAVLTPEEADTLFLTLREIAAEGRTVIFISHKLHEVMAVSDRVTVLRAGKAIGTVPTRRRTPQSLASLMIGHDVESAQRTARRTRRERRRARGRRPLGAGRPGRRRREGRLLHATRGRDRGGRRRRRQRPARARGDDRGRPRRARRGRFASAASS